jgi:hypothetical protein
VSERVGGEVGRERGSDVLSSPADTHRHIDTSAPRGHVCLVSTIY